MRNLIIVTMLLAPVAVLAQPNGGSAAPAGSAAAGSASAAPTAPPEPPPAVAPAADLRKTCVDAMNADESFATSIIEIADKKMNHKREDDLVKTHQDAADHVAKNERHVIMAYSAMWVVAALFVLFLWRRQQGLKIEIARLQKDLATATKEPEKPEKREL
jgi:hypothetical protein